MKTLKKALAMFLCAVLMMSMAALTGFAGEAADADEQVPDCLAWEVQFDRDAYGLFDTVRATVTVTNTSDLFLSNLTLTAFSADFAPTAVFYHQRLLASGASCTFSYDCRLLPGAAGLPFFARLLLYLRELLFGVVRGNAVLPDPPSVASAQVAFGRYGQHEIQLYGAYDTMTADPETVAQTVARYNAAFEKGADLQGTMQMTYVEGSLKAGGGVGAIMKQLEPALRKALEKNRGTVDTLPGSGPLLPEDVLAVSVREAENGTEMTLLLAEQQDGFDADPVNGGAVARGFGPLSSVKSALDELGATVESGEDTITMTYTEPSISVTVDSATGKIVAGAWHFRIAIRVGQAQMSLNGVSATLKDFEAAVDTDIAFSTPAIAA
ncbi:MAG: hypothetical protein IJK64_07815 [Clostridia bacterium]|nr:hypothetical protein [Clostridia bacterium]